MKLSCGCVIELLLLIWLDGWSGLLELLFMVFLFFVMVFLVWVFFLG